MVKKKDYHHGDLRNALLAAAREELIEIEVREGGDRHARGRSVIPAGRRR